MRKILLSMFAFTSVTTVVLAGDSKAELTDSQILVYVGQLKTENPQARSGYSSCSASRVGKRLILTAEHCLSFRHGRFDPTYSTTFYPAVAHGRMPYGAKPVTVIDAWHGGARFNYNTILEDRNVSDYMDDIPNDWAIGYLEEEPFEFLSENEAFVPILPYSRVQNANLITIGYGGRGASPQVPLVDFNCHRIHANRVRANVIDTTCYAVSGDSGGPVFVMLPDKSYAQVGIVNTGSRLLDPNLDERDRLLILIFSALANFPPDYRSSFIAVEQFYNTLLQVKTTYGELHPKGVEARASGAGQTQYTQPRTQYQQPQYYQPQRPFRRWRRR